MPLGPKERVKAMELVKGGEISGRSVTAEIANFNQAGMESRVTAKAKIKPMMVPVRPTAVAKTILLTMALLSYQLSKKGFKFSKVKCPSTQKVTPNNRTQG